MNSLHLIALSAAVPSALAAAPQVYEDLSVLDARIAATTGIDAGFPGGAAGPMDRRIRLSKCAEPLVIDQPLYDAIAVRCLSAGWRVRVVLLPKQSFPSKSYDANLELIHRGDTVDLVIDGAGFTASTSVIAIDNGAKGETVRVIAKANGKPIMAVVTDRNEVRVTR
jgi:flagellar basal body P-ring formation protein FlgA